MLLIRADTLQPLNIISSLPPYATLSHTWSSKEYEYQDLVAGRGQDKPGFRKVLFCAKQAQADGLQFFWVDTCCIDRSNNTELTEAINSMYSWFAGAAKCYVYLDDVTGPTSDLRFETAFEQSRWFTRGWTLQELLAPRHVDFFTSDGLNIGSKLSLLTPLARITGIPMEVLDGSKRCDDYSVSERMAWAANRFTTRVEDQAYCLMGLFDVNMPVIYGEGSRAMQRLHKELMEVANQASGLRLLVTNSQPLAIETFVNQEGLEYGILSHTWSHSEVSFQDVLVGKAPSRKGYLKIKKCCEQAARDGLKYLWVDTCCINKTSSAELQEAICSMYKWYKNAQVCYVYLEEYENSRTPSSSSFASCRWFKRGWTLQELIAPSNVKFYDKSWNQVGTKASMYMSIASITGINTRILKGEQDPSERTVAERMSWARGRSTTRIEDSAYSLMGLFNVFMPMLYGEGGRAFMRLQEEILKQSEDHTLFAWSSLASQLPNRGLLARSPDEFSDLPFGNDVHSRALERLSHFDAPDRDHYVPATLTSRGVHIALPLLGPQATDKSATQFLKRVQLIGEEIPPYNVRAIFEGLKLGHTFLALICRLKAIDSEEPRVLCIWITRNEETGIFKRFHPSRSSIVALPREFATKFRTLTVYIQP